MQCLCIKQNPSDVRCPELDQNEMIMREGLKWQQRVADAVCSYIDEIAGVFEAFINIHEMLEISGAGEAEGAGPVVKSLLNGLRSAHTSTGETRRSTRTQLETHRGVLSACTDDIANADKAALELRRLKEKIAALTAQDAKKHGAGAVSAKVARSREKLKQTTDQANAAKARAQNSLQTCISRRGYLCKLTSEVVNGTVDALRFSGWRIPMPGGESGAASDPSSPKTFESSLIKGKFSPNPFDNSFRTFDDIAKTSSFGIKTIPEHGASSPGNDASTGQGCSARDGQSSASPEKFGGRARSASGSSSGMPSENNVLTRFVHGGSRSSNPFGGHDRFLDLPPRSAYVDVQPVDSRGLAAPELDAPAAAGQPEGGGLGAAPARPARRDRLKGLLGALVGFCSARPRP